MLIWIFSISSVPWRKCRIEIHSESIRTFPIHSDICIRANANHSEPQFEKRFVSRLMKNGQKSIRLNPINYETSIRMNPNRSEWIWTSLKPNFQSRKIRINPISDWSIPDFQWESIRMNPRSERFILSLIKNSVWINPSSDWFVLI